MAKKVDGRPRRRRDKDDTFAAGSVLAQIDGNSLASKHLDFCVDLRWYGGRIWQIAVAGGEVLDCDQPTMSESAVRKILREVGSMGSLNSLNEAAVDAYER
jgi:hypothetical protein